MDADNNLRPFYFNVVVWGQTYRDYFLDFCVPALLSPRNIPSLDRRRNSKFLICTTLADWEAIKNEPVMKLLEEYVEPVLLEIPAPGPGVSSCVHMGIGHKLATEMAFRDKAYFIALTPDLVLSDGAVACAEEQARQGKEMVLTVALRFSQQPFFEKLQAQGLMPTIGEHARKSLTLPSRMLVRMALGSLHSETSNYLWDVPYCYATLLVACIWRHNVDEGAIIHSFSWAPLLLDYAAVRDHDTETFEKWTFDGDYVHNNFGHSDKMYIVRDSDEAMLLSWSPEGGNSLPTTPTYWMGISPIRKLAKQYILCKTYYHQVMDPLKRDIVRIPVFWHTEDITKKYNKTAKYSSAVLSRIIKYHFVLTCIRFLMAPMQMLREWAYASPGRHNFFRKVKKLLYVFQLMLRVFRAIEWRLREAWQRFFRLLHWLIALAKQFIKLMASYLFGICGDKENNEMLRRHFRIIAQAFRGDAKSKGKITGYLSELARIARMILKG